MTTRTTTLRKEHCPGWLRPGTSARPGFIGAPVPYRRLTCDQGLRSAVVRSLQQLVLKQLVTGRVFAKGLKLIASKDAFQILDLTLPSGRVLSSSSRSSCNVIHCTGFSILQPPHLAKGVTQLAGTGAGITALEGTPFVLRQAAPHAKILTRIDGPFQAGLNHLAATAYCLRLLDLQESGPVFPIGKNSSGSSSTQAARWRRVIRIGLP